MFGQKDDQGDGTQAATDAPAPDAVQSTGVIPDPAAVASTEDWQHPGTPLDTPPPAEAPDLTNAISPAGGFPSSPNDRIVPGGEPTVPEVPEEPALPEPAVSYTPDSPSVDDGSTGLVTDDDVSDAELIDIKKKALSELIPLIDKLDQPPQEKFRTIMMMIQASDDSRLVEKAYESAHAIEDEEARAQALLDIVNEINYFTQQPEASDTAAV